MLYILVYFHTHEKYKVYRYLISDNPFDLPKNFGVMAHELEIIPPKPKKVPWFNLNQRFFFQIRDQK